MALQKTMRPKTCAVLGVLALVAHSWAQAALDGNDRYQLALQPHKVGERNSSIVSWRVQLIDPRRLHLGNYLVSTKPPEPLSDRVEDCAWWLDPSPYPVVPLLARRVFKVENFYCVVQVKDYRLLTPESHLVQSMKVEVQFTGTDPRHN